MPILNSRENLRLTRISRPASDKIIFISCEGQVTEEQYFSIIIDILNGSKSKVKLISIMEENLNTPSELRTFEQNQELSKSMPWQLVEKLDKFKEEKAAIYDFEHHLNDEFWVVADVDDHTSEKNINKWTQTLIDCDNKNYKYAITNPFFEAWLLLHHTEPNDDDYKYAVTENHPYEKTSHFKERLNNDCGAGLKNGKNIKENQYTLEKIKNAIERAEKLHNKSEKWPHNFGSTVYILLNNIMENI